MPLFYGEDECKLLKPRANREQTKGVLAYTPDSSNINLINMENIPFYKKEVLTSNEVAMYMGISKSHLYKLTMRQEIPHYKPMGKLCYFNRAEVEEWLQNNRVATINEINQKAHNYCLEKGGRK